MPALMEPPPQSQIEAVTEILHGVPVTDPYRWLEEQDSARTRKWLAAQTRYARSYLDAIPGRDRIRERVRGLLDVETYDSLHKVGPRYFFRKRLPGQEQPCICFREGLDGPEEALIDPSLRGTGPYTAVKPLRISSDGRLLLYEVKQGGERTGTFEVLDIHRRQILSDALPRGYLRGFAFSPDSRAFYYVHEIVNDHKSQHHAAYRHILGTNFADDEEVFVAGNDDKLRLHIVPGADHLGFLVLRFGKDTTTDFYFGPFDSMRDPEPVILSARETFGPLLLKGGRVLAITDRESPNFRIVEVLGRGGSQPEFIDIVPACESPIQNWAVCGDRILVSYLRGLQAEIDVFDLCGNRVGHVPVDSDGTVRLLGASEDGEEALFEQESFTKPIEVWTYSLRSSRVSLLAQPKVPFDSERFTHERRWYSAKDGTQIPVFLVGRRDVREGAPRPTIMTSYGGYGVPMTPQFSVFVAFLMERGCLFALPSIRGGSEFGAEWHSAAKRCNRQVAFDDFIAAAEWLIETGRTQAGKLAIFGGSNSGLLVGAALTQRPDLFRAVVCMVPMLDMLRYPLFDNAYIWKEEFGTAEDPDDFQALLGYSPYHNVHDGTAYPAIMIVSGDCDQNCNPAHARKMTARLQAANLSELPIILDYNVHRGHSPVLPLSERIEALTDRMAFLCEQLGLSM